MTLRVVILSTAKDLWLLQSCGLNIPRTHRDKMTGLNVPKIATEAEESHWRFENDDLVSDKFGKAAKEGSLKTVGMQPLPVEMGHLHPPAQASPTL